MAQIGHLLAGAARAVVDEVCAGAARPDEDDGHRLFAELILQEAEGRPSQPRTSQPRLHSRARLVRALYERLNRLRLAAPAEQTAASSS
ncbi:hypothetical protein [Streptomyces venezuelae]|uniref:hypothetical protein n=1 Tax=Streptomyces venezuelae TaxID=54571 RepID=UPI00123B125F|nr:hypothetical protein [Streptomyces venezuelae]